MITKNSHESLHKICMQFFYAHFYLYVNHGLIVNVQNAKQAAERTQRFENVRAAVNAHKCSACESSAESQVERQDETFV